MSHVAEQPIALHATYDVVVQRVSDGEIRTCHMDFPWTEDGSWFWWTDGNASCDCNRHLDFERAGGRNPNLDDDSECGDTRYRVLRFEFLDGTSKTGPDVMANTCTCETPTPCLRPSGQRICVNLSCGGVIVPAIEKKERP